jgi:hypothetical protein
VLYILVFLGVFVDLGCSAMNLQHIL